MKLYLLRHTPTAAAPGICYGFLDIPLAEGFPSDFAAARAGLRAAGLSTQPRIFSSPLQRCRKLADRLARELDIEADEIRQDDRLKELNFGEWEGRAWDEIQTNDGERAARWMDGFVDVPCPGGESYLDLARRARSFLEELALAAVEPKLSDMPARDQPTLVVAHGGSIRALLAGLLEIPLKQSFAYEIECGRLSCLEWDPAMQPWRARLLYLNR
jgi:alpha-ribazole phosphatase